jgi:hypothetical protein
MNGETMLPAEHWAELAENRLADIDALMTENSELRELLRDVWRWGRTTELAERVEALGVLRTAGERE